MPLTQITEYGPACEPWGAPGWLQPISAWTSVTYVLVGIGIIVWVLLSRRRSAVPPLTVTPTSTVPTFKPVTRMILILAILAIGNGVGSVIQHGPEPWWNELVHDPPLTGTLALVAADAFADLSGRRLRHWWWAAPTALTAVLALAWHPAAAVLMVGAAVPAIGLTLVRLWKRPALRVLGAAGLALLAVGGLIGTLGMPGGPLCRPDSAFFASGWSTHSIWHLLSATAFIPLAHLIGRRTTASEQSQGRRLS